MAREVLVIVQLEKDPSTPVGDRDTMMTSILCLLGAVPRRCSRLREMARCHM